MTSRRFIIAIMAVGAALASAHASSRSAGSEDEAVWALVPFQRLIGGEWHLEGSYQEFEWGVGRRSVKSRGYITVAGTPKLVSEGIWFWHPGERTIRGVFTAIDMPFVFFEYRTRWEGKEMASNLRSFSANGNEKAYVEMWTFTDDEHYHRTLYEKTLEGLEEQMAGTYERR